MSMPIALLMIDGRLRSMGGLAVALASQRSRTRRNGRMKFDAHDHVSRSGIAQVTDSFMAKQAMRIQGIGNVYLRQQVALPARH